MKTCNKEGKRSCFGELYFYWCDFEVLGEYQGGATHHLEKQVLEQTFMYYMIPEYASGTWKNLGVL